MVEPQSSVALGMCRIPLAAGFQDQVSRTAVKMWPEVGLDDFWRCFLALYLCKPTALGICQQPTNAQSSPDCSALGCTSSGPWALKHQNPLS